MFSPHTPFASPAAEEIWTDRPLEPPCSITLSTSICPHGLSTQPRNSLPSLIKRFLPSSTTSSRSAQTGTAGRCTVTFVPRKRYTAWVELMVRETSNLRRWLWSTHAGVFLVTMRSPVSQHGRFSGLAYVSEKIASTRRSTDGSLPPSFPPTAASLTGWKPLLADALRRLIQDTSSKSCELDLFPPLLIKEFIVEFLRFRFCYVA